MSSSNSVLNFILTFTHDFSFHLSIFSHAFHSLDGLSSPLQRSRFNSSVNV